MEWYLSFLHLWFADSLGCPAIEDTHQYQYGFAIWKGGTLSTRENDPVFHRVLVNVPLSLDIHRTCNPGLGPLVSGDTENPQLQRERLSNLFCLKISLKWIATLFYQPWKMGSDFREENKCASYLSRHHLSPLPRGSSRAVLLVAIEDGPILWKRSWSLLPSFW